MPLPLHNLQNPLRVDAAGVARVGQTRVTLETVVRRFLAGDTPEEIADAYVLDLSEAYAAVTYFLQHRAEVDDYLRACEDDPDYLIDTATLTGAQLIALGTETSGAMGTDAFRDRVVAAGTAVGESLWPMPLPPRLRTVLDSPVADIVNLPKDRWASMLVAATFLKDFVPDGLDWVHLDIAGPALAAAASGYNSKGGTGVIVRTIVASLTDLAES